MAFNFQPTLHGSILSLLPMVRDDFEALYQIARNSIVWQQHPVPELSQRGAFFG